MAGAMGQSAEIIDVREHPDTAAVVGLAGTLLREGELVAVPTETVYGLLANADLPQAVERLNRAKGRPADRPYTYLIPDVSAVEADRADVTLFARKLIARYWPGPLTLVLRVNDLWRGYRLPDHDLVRRILRAAGCRVFAPSANLSGSPEPLTAQDVQRQLGDRIRLILDAGPVPIGRPSTVVKVHPDRCEILREGAVSRTEIDKTCADPLQGDRT